MKETRWFLTALLLLFIGLKLTNYIDWSWWWVAAPFWGPLALAGVARAIYGCAWLLMSEEQRKVYRLKRALENMQTALQK